MQFKKRLKNHFISYINKLPYVRNLYKENESLKKRSSLLQGHFYSPIVSLNEIKKRESDIWKNKETESIDGIDLRTIFQIELLKEIEKYYKELPFKSNKQDGLRYYFENEYYSYTDGIILYSIIRQNKPKRLIEIGSGFSSAVILDTNSLFFDGKIDLTFIEPYPERLFSLINEEDRIKTKIRQSMIQDVELNVFKELQKGDILFIDSSHVVKTGSDLNYILFKILPGLNEGVIIHFHDIFFPFEYPKNWVYRGINWNECYFLKSFLMYNSEFQIILFSDFLHKFYPKIFKAMPLCKKNTGGNLWIEKKEKCPNQ